MARRARTAERHRPRACAEAEGRYALVAAIDERDRNHGRSVDLLTTIRGAHLLTLWELVERGVLRVVTDGDDWVQIARLMAKYRDAPMALADGSAHSAG